MVKADTIKVRLLQSSDLPALERLYQDDQLVEQAGLVLDANPEFKRMVFASWVDHQFLWGIFSHQLLIGTINLFPQEQGVEIGYLLRPAYQHQGIMTKAVGQVLKKTTARPIFAKVRVENTASKRVLQKNEFKLEATEQGWFRFLKN